MVGGKTALLSGVGSTAGRLNRFGVGSTGAVFSAIERRGAEEGNPFFNDLTASGFNDHHDVPQGAGGNLRIVVAQVAAAGGRDPDLRGVGGGRSLRDVDVDRL